MSGMAKGGRSVVVNKHAQTVLQQAWLTCQRHWHHMQHALQALEPHLPVLGQDLTNGKLYALFATG